MDTEVEIFTSSLWRSQAHRECEMTARGGYASSRRAGRVHVTSSETEFICSFIVIIARAEASKSFPQTILYGNFAYFVLDLFFFVCPYGRIPLEPPYDVPSHRSLQQTPCSPTKE